MPKGFTMIELLVVVAVVAILAAIAVPNVLEAQVRSKVARVQNEFEHLAAALELYRSENQAYPPYYVTPAVIFPRIQRLVPLTTPIEYVPSIPEDVFNHMDTGGNKVFVYAESRTYFQARSDYQVLQDLYDSFLGQQTVNAEWILRSRGPSGRLLTPPFDISKIYDPTNGTISLGNVARWGP